MSEPLPDGKTRRDVGRRESYIPSKADAAPPKDSVYSQDDLKIPAIELPKGGGALKSIDEKFQVNAANGTLSFSIPLPMSQSRSDVAPGLSLGYNSGGGDGVFGLGWSLTRAAIQRRTDKRLPEYLDASESDVFLLSGAEDLVPALVEGGSGNWNNDEFTAPTGEAVKRYRPRVEGAFARIERITPVGTASFYWKTTTRDNIATIFGRSAAARIADPSFPDRIFKWLPELTYDDKGNCLEYFYVAEDFTKVAGALHEANRLNGLAPCANRYLKRAKYGNKNPYYAADPLNPAAPVNPEYFFELVFDFGDHDAAAPTPEIQNAWPCRLNPFSDYKPGFEIRTYRLCQRVLLFHYFKELNDGETVDACLVRSLDLSYRYFGNGAATAAELRNMEVDYPVAVRQTGWKKTGAATYDHRSLPAVEFTYQELNWDKTVQTVSASNLESDPVGLGRGYQFVDLWNEGISGILTDQGGGWFYKKNLGDGTFTPALAVAQKPSFSGLAGGSLQLQDLEGDGRKFIVSTQTPLQGSFELSDDGEWQPFVAFQNAANVSTNDPYTKFIDLDGDGRSDMAVSEDNVFTWYPSLGVDGYDSPRQSPKPFDEERGPALVFSDPTGSIFLAGMSGSGLTDIVRVRNGEICYWPNLGYGRFGAKVNMDFAPVFDTQDLFNPEYIHLAGVSGTGASDILYLGRNRFRAWLNQSGNAWSETQEIDPFPTTELPNQLSVADFLGNGTACLVWSSPSNRYASSPLQYVDLMGGRKPYLLSGYANQTGKVVEWEYKSSTHFYLADQQAGRDWITKLPITVQCVSKVSSRDTVTGAYLTTEYSYHHGYYDHAEREYRGFGRVEQTDTETFDEFVKSGASNVVNQPLHQAPMLTKTWFHTGAFFGEDTILARYRQEYFQNADFAEYHLPEPAVVPASISTLEMREAQRACKGTTIRQEIYGLDGVSMTPYSAVERNCLIQRLQPVDGNRYAVFLVTENESISYEYERNSKDPRIAHTLNVTIDEFGNVLQVASVAYPRQPGAVGLPARVAAEQQTLKISYAVNGYTGDVIAGDSYRLRLQCETAALELTGATPAASYFTLAEMGAAFAGAAAIGYEIAPDGSSQKRALKHSRTLFLKHDLSGPLPLGQMDSLGLVAESYRLTFTAPLLASIYGTRVTPAFVAEGGYIHSNDFKLTGLFPATDDDDEWWQHGHRAQYPASPETLFYMPNGHLDPLGKLTAIRYYADYQLVVDSVTDAVGNATSVVEFDFRNLSPQLIKDANGNLREARFDMLGFLVGTAIEGKGSDADDFAGFTADVSDADIASFFADPMTNGPSLLQHATTRFVYDFTTIPVRVATIARETHYQASVASGIQSRIQYRFEYSDGFDNVAMRKVQAEPGFALELDGSNDAVPVDTTPNLRWIGSGRTVVNNKGKPVKQYEPYFSATYNYENDSQLVEIGVTSVLFYDPPGRNVRTEYPNGTFSKTDIQGWMTRAFDQNDTVLSSDWYTQRTTGPLAVNPRENQAAAKTAIHDNTPAVTHSDGMGRAFYAIRHNRFVDHATLALTDQFYETFTQLDIEGHTIQAIDPRGISVASNAYDMLGNADHAGSADSGDRWVLNDCTGKPIYKFDSKSQTFHTIYDAIRRPLQSTVAKGAAGPIVFNLITYGEGQADDMTLNLRTRIYEHRDQAGIVTSKSFDFKGNLLESTRVLTTDYQDDINWGVAHTLELETFTSESEFDALNRVTRAVAPNSNAAVANVAVPSYNETGQLQSVAVHLRGAAAATPFVTNIDYNEKSQRARIDYANGSTSVYKYDPLTFRMIGLVTARNTDPEQFWDDKSKITQPAFAGDALQFLTYTFDPVGNITYIRDDAQQSVYFKNQLIEPSCDYTYDAVYWLVDSLGREHIGSRETPGPTDATRLGNPQPDPGIQLQTYTLQYDYDASGNMLLMKNAGNWSMAFTYGAPNNHLQTAVPSGAIGTPFAYPYDLHGNAVAMPHLTMIDWDFADRMRHTAVSASGTVSQESWYVYDASGQRVRKVVQKGALVEERLYFGNLEIFRSSTSGTQTLERETLHVMDDTRRVAMVDTPTVKPAGSGGTQLTRYQYSNHLGTACLELDAAAQVISYEEYYAFGSTSYQGTDQTREIPAKRYRYTGKERDEETGFYYHGARYYAPWLARWTAADSMGLVDGTNVYAYANSNPVKLSDSTGTQGEEGEKPPDRSKADEKKDAKPADDKKDKSTDDKAEDADSGGGDSDVDPGNFPFANPTSGLGIMPDNALDLDVTIGGVLTTGIPDPANVPRRLLGGGLNTLQLSWRQQLFAKGLDLGLAIGTSQISQGGSSARAVVGTYSLTPTVHYASRFSKSWGASGYLQIPAGFRQGEPVPSNARGFIGGQGTAVVGYEPDNGRVFVDFNAVGGVTSTGGFSAGPNLAAPWVVGTQVSATVNLDDQHWGVTGEVFGYREGGAGLKGDDGTVGPGAGAWRYGGGLGVARNYSEKDPITGGKKQTSTIGFNVDYFRENISVDPSGSTGRTGINTNTILGTITFGYRKP